MATTQFSADVAALTAKSNVLSKVEFRGETTLLVDRGTLKETLRMAKDLGYTYLVDLSGLDNFGEDPRFAVVYELYHFERGDSLRIKAGVPEDDAEVETVADLWPTADWHEREAYDMYGVKFRGHPDLRRILMWEGYPFFPLRKDFPLSGRPSEMPDVAFTRRAPLEGGPFVTLPSTATTKDREPRSRPME
jgi:NADH-quinone oxidoreductase subunit C